MMLDRGEQLDWFGSTEIVAEAAIAAVCFGSSLSIRFTAESPSSNPGCFATATLRLE